MSFLFNATNTQRMTGVFTSTYGEPLTIAVWIKIASFSQNDTVINIGSSTSSVSDSHMLVSTNTSNEWAARSTNTVPASSDAVYTSSIDGTWTPIVCVIASDASRKIYIGSIGNVGSDTTSIAVGASLQYLRVGRNLAAVNYFSGYMAELAVWDSALSTDDITSYLGGTVATQIDAANLVGYWPFDYDNATQTNEGVDAGGNLSVVNYGTTGATYDPDHPTITGAPTIIVPNPAAVSAC